MTQPTYRNIRTDYIKSVQTIEVSNSTLVDVDAKGRVIGVESLDGTSGNSYRAVLADDRFRFVSRKTRKMHSKWPIFLGFALLVVSVAAENVITTVLACLILLGWLIRESTDAILDAIENNSGRK